jgi:hypothetical protein
MGFFTARERTELGKSRQTQLRVQGRAQEQVRNSVRDDFVARRRLPDNDLAGHVGSPFERATATSLREIDDLIVELRRRREELVSESAHLQSKVIEYAKLNQATIQSTEIITERLANLNKARDVNPMMEPNVENTSNGDDRGSRSEEYGNPETIFSQAKAKEISDDPTS